MVSREENREKFYSFVYCRSYRFVSVSLDRCSSSEKALKTCLFSQVLFHILTGIIKLTMKIVKI